MSDGNKSPLRFDRLPTEIVTRILTFALDTESITSTASTCRRFQTLVQENEGWILFRLVRSLLGVEVMAEAFLVYELKLMHETRSGMAMETVEEFIKISLKTRKATPRSMTMEMARSITRRHMVVESLGRRFIACCDQCHADLSQYCDPTTPGQCPKLDLLAPGQSLTSNELDQIYLALYRYEVYCCLFGHSEHNYPSRGILLREQSRFRTCYMPWELEQLACVYDFLRREAYPAFRDVARHDVLYGECRIPYDQRHSPAMKFVLESGLEYIHRLLKARDFQERKDVLADSRTADSISESHSFRPMLHLEQGSHRIWVGHDFAPFASKSDVTAGGLTVPDSGPRDAWLWIIRDQKPDEVRIPFDRWILRRWGWVFWDRARLDRIGALDAPFRPPLEEEKHIHIREQLAAEEVPDEGSYMSKMERSWRCRSVIFQGGGVGWWDFDDISKVTWLPSRQSSG